MLLLSAEEERPAAEEADDAPYPARYWRTYRWTDAHWDTIVGPPPPPPPGDTQARYSTGPAQRRRAGWRGGGAGTGLTARFV